MYESLEEIIDILVAFICTLLNVRYAYLKEVSTHELDIRILLTINQLSLADTIENYLLRGPYESKNLIFSHYNVANISRNYS